MKYIKEDIENILKKQKEKEGKVFEIDFKIDGYQQRLELAGTVYEDTEKETIENMQLKGQPYDSIHSNTNKTSDKVADTAINYKKEQRHVNKEDRDYLESEIDRLKLEKDTLNKQIARVKSWIDKLNTEEAIILEEFYINNEGKNWDKAVKAYNENEKINKELQKRRLKEISNNAIEKILKIVNI